MLLAGFPHRRRAVALGQHDHRAAGGLEIVHERIHAARRRRAERARGVALRRLGGAGVIDRMILEIVRQPLSALQPFAQFAVREVARHDHGPAERKPGLDRIPGKLGKNLLHRPAQVDVHDLASELGGIDLGQILRRVALELFEIDALAGDLAERLAVGRA